MGVAATSSSNARAVGYGHAAIYSDEEAQTLIEHWNGKAWKIQRSPNDAGGPILDQFFGVAATSSTDAWAVGIPIKGASIWHWNGRAWKAQRSPRRIGRLYAVAAKSSNIWAVGGNLAVHCG